MRNFAFSAFLIPFKKGYVQQKTGSDEDHVRARFTGFYRVLIDRGTFPAFPWEKINLKRVLNRV